MFAVIRIKGQQGIKKMMKTSLEYLNLTRPNHCIITAERKSTKSMIHNVNTVIAWGEINDETLAKMIKKKGKINGKKITDALLKEMKTSVEEIVKKLKDGSKPKDLGLSPVFRLHPPKGGHKNTKHIYPAGSLGHWGSDINSLLIKMI